MTVFEATANALFDYRDPLYPTLLISGLELSAERNVVVKLMIDIWLEANCSNPPITANINDVTDVDHLDGQPILSLFFKSPGERESFEAWFKSLSETDVPQNILTPFDVNDLLDQEDSLGIAGRVTHVFDVEWSNTDPDEFVKENYDLCVWLMKHSSQAKGKRIWYDESRECFFFEEVSAAVNFKLKFTVDEQLGEAKRTVNPKRRSSSEDYDYTGDYKKYKIGSWDNDGIMPRYEDERKRLAEAIYKERLNKRGY